MWAHTPKIGFWHLKLSQLQNFSSVGVAREFVLHSHTNLSSRTQAVREGWQLQRPNKSRRNVFVRLCEAKSCTDGLLLRLLHKRRIVFRAGCAGTIPMQALDEAKPSFAISPSHGANPAFSLHIARACTYFSLARILQLF